MDGLEGMPSSSASVERTFSIAGKVLGKYPIMEKVFLGRFEI